MSQPIWQLLRLAGRLVASPRLQPAGDSRNQSHQQAIVAAVIAILSSSGSIALHPNRGAASLVDLAGRGDSVDARSHAPGPTLATADGPRPRREPGGVRLALADINPAAVTRLLDTATWPIVTAAAIRRRQGYC